MEIVMSIPIVQKVYFVAIIIVLSRVFGETAAFLTWTIAAQMSRHHLVMGKTIAVNHQTHVLKEMEIAIVTRTVQQVYFVAIIIVMGLVFSDFQILRFTTIAAQMCRHLHHHLLHQFGIQVLGSVLHHLHHRRQVLQEVVSLEVL